MNIRLLLLLLALPSTVWLAACTADDDDTEPPIDDDDAVDDDDAGDDDDSSGDDDDDSSGDDDDGTPPGWSSAADPWVAIDGAAGTFGAAAAVLGDLDADGGPELAVLDTAGDGAVYVFFSNQFDGTPLVPDDAAFTFRGIPDTALGSLIVAAADLDGDALPDLLVAGSPFLASTFVLSGASIAAGGEVTADNPDAIITGLAPVSLAGPGDVDGDGLGDVLIGSPLNSQAGNLAGKTVLISSTDLADGAAAAGSAWASFLGEGANQNSGAAVGGSDLDGDGAADVVLSAPANGDAGANAGKVYVFSGTALRDAGGGEVALSSATWTLRGEAADDQLGSQILVFGDRDGDGRDDLALVAPRADRHLDNAGAAYLVPSSVFAAPGVLDLAAQVHVLSGEEGWGPSMTVGVAPDVEGDGVPDPIVAFPGHEGGVVWLFIGGTFGAPGPSLSTEDITASFEGASGEELGLFVASIGDPNGDDREDLVLTAPGTGRVLILTSPYGD